MSSRKPPPLPENLAGRGRGGRGGRIRPPTTLMPGPIPRSGLMEGAAPRPLPGVAGSSESAVESVTQKLGLMNTDESESIEGTGRGRCRGKLSTCMLRTRPDDCSSKVGTSGNVVTIATNHFIMKCKSGWNLLQYHVSFNIEEDRTYMKKKYVKQVANKLPPYICDGATLFTVTPLTHDNSPFEICTKREDDGKMIGITMKYTRQVSPMDFSYFQFFNIILRRCMENLDLQMLDRNYYDPNAKVTLTDLHFGIVAGLRTASATGDVRNAATRLLLGEIVITRYNNKTYKIDDIDWNTTPSSTFPKRDGSSMSFSDYYRERYNITIKDLKQPLLISLPRERDRRGGNMDKNQRIMLVPELCYMTGLSESQRSNFSLMKSLGEYTRQDPANRCSSLKKFSQRLLSSPSVKEELKKWNIELDEKLRTFQGRSLPPEVILEGSGKKISYPVENADWGSTFRNMKLFQPAHCQKWVSNGMGFQLDAPKLFEIQDDRVGTYVNEINSTLCLRPPPQMIMVVVPRNTGDAYSAIKKICCVEKPIISQVITGTLLKKPKGLMSVATKVAVQMATKLGAEPWGVSIPIKNTMVIGYDSYHDTSLKGKSVGAVVSSINDSLTRFVSSVTIHQHNEELLNQIGMCISRALRKYNEVNNAYPKRIIIYRDGVGDGQIETVKQHEIPAIKEVLKKLNITPKFTFIIVSKRVNSRFFLKTPQRMLNPDSGTVIDDVVTLPERYDFFLVSQSVRQGTVNPTSYNIIEDESGLKPDHIQKLTYKLTHLYYNWPGTVRVPSVCQYAHKLAYLVGTSIHQDPDASLDSTLYYL
ncbi:AUB [Lepeophtheirus salmonis]|uniref:AUB n=1 Tax=Lepeophtheirus salmonis TaxID=72036 RepID=A0A7R8CQJ9_LEPSM|nr:AUB [Lepeophtheirus salmonis]CAF2896062.1 AUB [Lepeophtheirus salmonis]